MSDGAIKCFAFDMDWRYWAQDIQAMRPFKLNLLASGLILLLSAAGDSSAKIQSEPTPRGAGLDADLREAAWWRDPAWAMSAAEFKAQWIRLRGIPMGSEPRGVVQVREVLMALKQRGAKVCVLLRWNNWNREWTPEGDRPSRPHLPGNLQEAYERGRMVALGFGDLVDAWEIDNEPDLGFVPEASEGYATYLKAMYLGLKAGAEEKAESGKLKAEGSSNSNALQSPLVLMGALGLPPGPWLERFAANDGFAYTDGFNYHYYGYADDFTGVYQQHEAAVTELSRWNLQNVSGNPVHSAKKDLPILMTEIGYGMLGKSARDTKDGRLRQWRWFRTVREQVADLRIEAPIAFVLPPYLEYGSMEFGLTQKPGEGSSEPGDGDFKAGGISYRPEDFGAKSTEPWMEMIGKQIGGGEVTPALAQWLATRAGSGEQGARSRSWWVSVPSPSPVVIDFIYGEGLSFVKRFNGSFVTATSPVEGEKSEEHEPKPRRPDSKTQIPPVRTEEFMIHVRTQNGNLYEVYPTRLASPEWQTYQEPQDNFTMSFYGRAELPWRFKDNKPASLVVVMYPKSLPATYEFRRVQLIRIGEIQKAESGRRLGADGVAMLKAEDSRYGHGKVILYNFSDKPVTGRLQLPEAIVRAAPDEQGIDDLLTLAPMERHEIHVSIKVPWGEYEKIEVPITFVPEDKTIPPARFLTAFLPDIGGLNQAVVAMLLPQPGAVSTEQGANHKFLLTRPRADEEAPIFEQGRFFAQQGATVEPTADGFTVAVTETPPGKEQRVEVEIPWPEGLGFAAEDFLSVDFRLGGVR